MKVIDLNDFLRRAMKEGILPSLVLDFRVGTYGTMSSSLLKVAGVPDRNGVVMTDDRGYQHRWGLDLDSSSAEIIDLRKVSGRTRRGEPFILVKLGKKCSGRGMV